MPLSRRGKACLAVSAILALAGVGRAQDGAALLEQAGCAACHGAEGRGTPLAPAIAGPGLDAAAFRRAVRTARGAMPAFGPEVLSEDAITMLQTFLGSLPAAPVPVGRAEDGALRFAQVGCYSCHSNQGQGGTQGPRIGPQPIRWARFSWYVRHPAGQMPPYSEVVLSDQDLADIRAFLASRPAPRRLSDLPLLAP